MFLLCISTFFFNDTATTEIYTYAHTLSLHDALPISIYHAFADRSPVLIFCGNTLDAANRRAYVEWVRSEEHTSELQSLMRISYAVFCLKKTKNLTTNDDQHNKSAKERKHRLRHSSQQRSTRT